MVESRAVDWSRVRNSGHDSLLGQTEGVTADELRALAERALRMWNERDLDGYFALFQPDVRYHGSGAVELEGVQALRARYDKALAWCPDLTITSTLAIVDGERQCCASIQLERGTTVSGEPFGFEGMTFYRFGPDGLVSEVWEKVEPLLSP